MKSNQPNNNEKFDQNKVIFSDDFEASCSFKAKKYLYGYKFHLGIYSKLGFIIAVHSNSASFHDTKKIMKLVKNINLYNNAFVLSDKGYFTELNRAYLIYKNLKDGIIKLTKVKN